LEKREEDSATHMRHILYISHSNGFHGAERILVHLIKAEIKAGNRVSLLIPLCTREHDLESALPKEVTLLKWPYKTSGQSWWRTLCVRLYNLPSVLRGAWWCKQHDVDTVYSNTSITILGAAIAKWTHLPHWWHFHEEVDELYGWRHSLAPMYRRWLMHGTTTVFISRHQKENWEKELGTALPHEIRYNPIEPLERISCAPHEGIRIGYLGNLEKRKNIPFLIRVYKRIHARYPQTELWICGAKDAHEIRAFGQADELAKQGIRIMEATKEVALFYNQIDLFALPSLKEVMPLVSAEAMSCGVCTLQTTASGWNELMENGKDCLFLPPTDEDAWVDAILRCMDETYRTRIATNGLKKCKQLCES